MTPVSATLSISKHHPDDALLRKILWRIIPFLLLCYIVNFLDRMNVSFAALTMNQDLGISAREFGWVAGLFFLGYSSLKSPATCSCSGSVRGSGFHES